MKMMRYVLLAVAATALFSLAANGQTRKPVKRTPAPKTAATLPPLDVRAARVTVSNQLVNVTRFVSLLGPIGKAIEDVDAEAKVKKLKKESLDKNASDKQTVITTIRNLRQGMVKLESDFRVKPALK